MEGKFQDLLNCAQSCGGAADHVANGAVTSSSGGATGNGSLSPKKKSSSEKRHSPIPHSPLPDSQRRMSKNSPPVPPRKNPPPPPPPREGHPRWGSMKDSRNSNNSNVEAETIQMEEMPPRRASDSCRTEKMRNESSAQRKATTERQASTCSSGASTERPSDLGGGGDGSEISDLDAWDDSFHKFIPLSPEYEQSESNINSAMKKMFEIIFLASLIDPNTHLKRELTLWRRDTFCANIHSQ